MGIPIYFSFMDLEGFFLCNVFQNKAPDCISTICNESGIGTDEKIMIFGDYRQSNGLLSLLLPLIYERYYQG